MAPSGRATCLYSNLKVDYSVFPGPRSLENWAKITFFKKQIADISNYTFFSFYFDNSSILFVNDDIYKRTKHTIKAQIPFTRKAGFSLWVNPQSSSTAPDSKIGYDWKGKMHSFKVRFATECIYTLALCLWFLSYSHPTPSDFHKDTKITLRKARTVLLLIIPTLKIVPVISLFYVVLKDSGVVLISVHSTHDLMIPLSNSTFSCSPSFEMLTPCLLHTCIPRVLYLLGLWQHGGLDGTYITKLFFPDCQCYSKHAAEPIF